MKIRHVVAGQYLGFSALVAISLVGYFARLIVPHEWIGFLGLLPIAIGVRHFPEHDNGEDKKQESTRTAGAFSVAAVTFANGGDIGIYAPLFATSDLASLLVMLIVFFIMLAVWCVGGSLSAITELLSGRFPATATSSCLSCSSV